MKPIIAEKIKSVNHLTEKINKSKSFIIFDYKGLSVSSFTELRSESFKNDCKVKVYSNNILKRAVISANHSDLSSVFKGNKAFIYSYESSIQPAKIIYDFANKYPMIKIICGLVENKFVSIDDINVLSSIPSKEILLSMLAASMLIPVTQLSLSLNTLLKEKK